MHSTTRVNGFLGMQSQDIYTAAQKHCGMAGGWWWALPAQLAALRLIEAQQAYVERTHAQKNGCVSCAET
jgi:hypothetical protein